jgi:hypothetical protein
VNNDNLYASGPVSTLPGAVRSVEPGDTCDNDWHLHDGETRPAVHRVQGETDSFGAEYFYACAECYAKMRAEIAAEKETPKTCDWCKAVTTDCILHRDQDEGSCGPVYSICSACRTKEHLAAIEELKLNHTDGDWITDAMDMDEEY